MSLTRRLFAALIAAAAAQLGGGCALPTGGGAERIVEVASGRTIERAELLRVLSHSRYVLLGELHDNPAHHARRGELISALRPGSVVAEQMPAGGVVAIGQDLQASLAGAGFDTKGWRWPLHEPVFAAAANVGARVLGGNLARDVARAVARGGESAWPVDLRAPLAAAALPALAQKALDDDLVRGHCGHLSAARLPGMRAAQRARDASMLLALQRSAGTPVVLIAGNGHVRLDYGVGQLLRRLEPDARTISVGFVEPDDAALPDDARYDYIWVTAKAERKDPCEGFVPASVR